MKTMNTIAPVKTHPVIIDVNSIAKVIDHEGLDKNSNGTESDKKSQDSSIEKQGVSIVKLFEFSDCVDKLLMAVGLIASLASAAMFPAQIVLYGQAANAFVDFGLKSGLDYSKLNATNISQDASKCNKIIRVDEITDIPSRVNDVVTNYIIAGCLSLLAYYIAHVCFNTAAERQSKRMRNALFKAIVRQDIGFFDSRSSGEINSIITHYIDQVKNAIGFKFADVTILFARSIGLILLSLISAIKFGAVFVALFALFVICIYLMSENIKKYTGKELAEYGAAGAIAQEALSSMRTVLALGLQQRFIHKYDEKLQRAENMAIAKCLVAGCFSSIAEFIVNLTFAIAMYYGVWLVRHDCDYNAGNMLESFFATLYGALSLVQAMPFIKEVSEGRMAAAKIFSIIGLASKIDVFAKHPTKPSRKLAQLRGDIEFKSVEFSYPTRSERLILDKMSFKIPAGRTVALVGSSGGGKSTVVSLLERFYSPNAGQILIDGVAIEELDLHWLRSQMALVSQEPVLFNKSIKENIRMGKLEASDAEVEEAAKMANAHKFIINFTHGYETQVGERSVQLSGGQKQRIAIARALLSNPRILLLDEATSALDYASERMVQRALDRAKLGRTTIVIAHRLSTIRNVDLIVSCAGGRVVETGNHDELMRRKGLYHELVTRQTASTSQAAEDDDDDDSCEGEIAPLKAPSRPISSISSSSSDEQDEEEKKQTHLDKTTNDASTTKRGQKHRRTIGSPFKYERKLLGTQRPELGWIVLGAVGQLITGSILPIGVLCFEEIYAVLAIADEQAQLAESLKYMGVLLASSVASGVAAFLHHYSLGIAGARLTKRLRLAAFHSLLRQEIAFHDMDENRSSALISQLASSVPLCKGISSDKLGLILQAISGIGFSFILSLTLNWKLCFALTAFVPVVFFSSVITGRTSVKASVKSSKGGAAAGVANLTDEAGRITADVLDNMKTVASLCKEQYFMDELAAVFDSRFAKSMRILHVQAFFYALANSVTFFIQATTFALGFALMQSDGLRPADMYKIFASLTVSTLMLSRVYSQLPDQRKCLQATRRVYRLMERRSKIDSMSPSGLRPESCAGHIRFDNVLFHYPLRPDMKILQGFSLDVKSGQISALVGPSGSGKSTTIALLLRFYDIDSGSITLDGVDIRQLNIAWLRSKIGLVSQEPVLFDTSLWENISYGDLSRRDITSDEVSRVVAQANIRDKIESLPQKYDTVVGNKGSLLSGGEKQRVAIARALIRKPVILLLDEATSALDTQSEQIVQDALDKAQHGRTCIVIAHRLSTIKNSDKINVVKDGVIIEEGTHNVLMQNKQFFYNLHNQK